MKIEEIWDELENDKSSSYGILLRRYSGAALPDIFIAIKSPEKSRCIAVPVSDDASALLSSLVPLREVSIDIIQKAFNNKDILVIKLVDNSDKEIFAVLCEDLINNISQITDENILINQLINRFEKWRSLFDRAASEGLLPEQQRGLFGELCFLRKCLLAQSEALSVINSWIGPYGDSRDFQLGRWGVEVKTTIAKNHQKVQISNERQLDTSNLQYMFLYHLSLELLYDEGETLNDVVDHILEILSENSVAANCFKSKLLEGGYFEKHRSLYDKHGYFLRNEQFFLVKDDFPRIEEKDIRKGVGDVKYTILIANCDRFVLSEPEVFLRLNFNE